MVGSKLKYKLHSTASTAEDGSLPPLCAFFNTVAGCKNGDKCKFRHVVSAEGQAHSGNDESGRDRSSSVVSSESESADSAEKYIGNNNDCKEGSSNIFAPPGDKKELKQDDSNKSQKKKKKKRKKNKTDEDGGGNIFANPKKAVENTTSYPQQQPEKKKQKVSQEPSGADNVSSPPAPTPEEIKRLVKPPPKLAPNQNSTDHSVIDATPQEKLKTASKQKTAKKRQNDTIPSFREMNLPITSFSLPSTAAEEKAQKEHPPSKQEKKQPPNIAANKPEPPLPKSTPTGQKWQKAVLQTRSHDQYDSNFSFEKYKELDEALGRGNSSEWVKARSFGPWCASNPQAIAIDCEMCETKDPLSGVTDPKALCRISVVNAENPDDVLLDTLVKPAWPVVDYRSWINGIKKEHLDTVQFTLRHAQAFMMALCSEETVIVGHALHNDLTALKMEHHCNVDSAMLFEVKNAPEATPSLRDLALSILKKEMPNTHDSVNDATTALKCLETWVQRDGDIEPVTKTSNPNRNRSNASQLFVHRIPRVCQPSHLSTMFLTHTSLQPSNVDDIEFSGNTGRTLVTFMSPRHANLAFDTLEGNGEPDKSGRMQKNVYLRSGDYVRVRKMVLNRDRNNSSSPKTPGK